MKTTQRTPEQEQTLADLKRASHSLNSGIPSGVDGQSVEIQARAMRVLDRPTPWAAAVRITGMATGAVSEVMDRIEGTFASLQVPEPEVEILVSLVPADLLKHGIWLDLPIAIALLQVVGVLPELQDQGGFFLMGGLDIHGEVRHVPAALSLAFSARPGQTLIVPAANERECSLIWKRPGFEGCRICPVNDFSEVIAFFKGERELSIADPPTFPIPDAIPDALDFAAIRGQKMAKRAAMICAAGGHNLLLVGPPGEGKSSVAKALSGILPPLTDEEIVELTRIASASCDPESNGAIVTQRPMVAVHSTATTEALIGGGSGVAKPGEITRAHGGVLFLDEIAEFSKSTLDCLRQPIEEGKVHVARAGGTMTFPANFTLVGAMNPCKCGYHGTPKCHCTENQVRKYEQKLSGAMRDRIDLTVRMDRLTIEEQFSPTTTGESATMRAQVIRARSIQSQRFAGLRIRHNAAIPRERVDEFCEMKMTSDCLRAFKAIVANSDLSTRLKDRLAKVARTVADLDESERIKQRHVEEAAHFVVDERCRVVVESKQVDAARCSTPSPDQISETNVSDETPSDMERPTVQQTLF